MRLPTTNRERNFRTKWAFYRERFIPRIRNIFDRNVREMEYSPRYFVREDDAVSTREPRAVSILGRISRKTEFVAGTSLADYFGDHWRRFSNRTNAHSRFIDSFRSTYQRFHLVDPRTYFWLATRVRLVFRLNGYPKKSFNSLGGTARRTGNRDEGIIFERDWEMEK